MHRFLESGANQVPAYATEPVGESDVAVLILPTIYGIDEDLESLCEDLAYVGAKVVAVDPFWQVDPGPLGHDLRSVRRGLARKRAVTRKKGLANMRMFCSEVNLMCEKLIVLGIGYGGHLAYTAAAEGLVDAAVIWHGSSLTDFVRLASKIQVPVSMHFGDSDPVVPMDDVLLLKDAFAEHENVDIVVYENARHGFVHRNYIHYNHDAFEHSFATLQSLIERFRIED